MKIVNVLAKNFRSYPTLNWSIASNGLHLIDGKNLDTGRSNMVGKSTLIDSIAYALFGFLPKWGSVRGGQVDNVIMRGEESCSVTVTVENNNDTYKITRRRGKSAGLSILKNGVDVPGKVADLDNRIPEMIGLTSDQFLLSVYMSQKRNQSFFSMSDTERTDLLSKSAGLANLDKALEKAKDVKSTLQTEIDKSNGKIEALEAQVAKHPIILSQIDSEIDALMAQYAEVQNAYAEAKVKTEDKLKALDAYIGEQLKHKNESLTQDKSEILSQGDEIDKTISSLNDSLSKAPVLDSKYDEVILLAKKALDDAEKFNYSVFKLESDNDKHRDNYYGELANAKNALEGQCDHCGQSLPEEKRNSAHESHVSKANSYLALIKSVPPRLNIETFHENYKMALKTKSDAQTEIALKYGSLNDQIKMEVLKKSKNDSTLRTIDLNYKNEVAEIQRFYNDQKNQIEKDLNNILAQVPLVESKMEQADKHKAKTLESMREDNTRLQESKQRQTSLLSQMDEALDLIDLFGPKGYRTICFDGLISRISERASDLLYVMTDGLYSTRVDQVGETSKGQAKMILRPVITKGGQDVPEDDLSGGAEAMVNLAYDVALAEAISDTNCLFLDEALDGLDSIGKEAALNLLEEVARTRAVYLIDHTDQIKSAIQNVIMVENREGKSRLVSSEEESQDLSQACS